MLATVTMIALVSVGAVIALGILAYAIYITFYPFARTVGGGLQILKHYGEQRAKALQRDYGLIHDARLGYTMADGGDRIKKRRSPVRARNKK
jgi:hypothetical protein